MKKNCNKCLVPSGGETQGYIGWSWKRTLVIFASLVLVLTLGIVAASAAKSASTVAGVRDSDFGDGFGKQTTDFGENDHAVATAIQADGKIVVAGISGDDLAVAKYNVDGSLDTSFEGDGKVTAVFAGALIAIASKRTEKSWRRDELWDLISCWPATREERWVQGLICEYR